MPNKHALKYTHKTKEELRAEGLKRVIREMEKRKREALAEAAAAEKSGCFASITIFGLSIPAIAMLAFFV